MGCDIHAFKEDKIDGKWTLVDQPNIGRWYGLFEKMAGVRGDIRNALAPPRGLPDDVSEAVDKYSDYWGFDGHSHSWLTQEEINKITSDKDLFEDRFKAYEIFGWTEHLPEVKESRIVFWFDN